MLKIETVGASDWGEPDMIVRSKFERLKRRLIIATLNWTPTTLCNLLGMKKSIKP